MYTFILLGLLTIFATVLIGWLVRNPKWLGGCHVARTLWNAIESIEALPAVSAAWLAQAELSVEQLDPGAQRIQRLLNGYESPEWRAPFGETIISSYPGFG